jgi:putative NADH-flavin reductase
VKIAVIGASGWLGGAVTAEAVRRGHQVTAISRHVDRAEGLHGIERVVADVNDQDALVRAIAGHDAVISSVTDRTTADRSLIPNAARALLRAVPAAGVPRLLVFGGGGSLEVEPGVRAIDQPGFPAQYLAEARAQAEALEIFQREGGAVDWTYLSPPPHDLRPGARTGLYRARAGDEPVTDDEGHSRITSGDLASALVDELEEPRFSRQRFTAAAS